MLDHEAPRFIPMGDEDENKALARILKELDKEPPPEAIKRKDGFDYLHGYYVFARANQVFGALKVSYTKRESKVLHRGTAQTRSGERCYVVCEVTAGVTIALPGDRTFYTEGTATCDGIGRSYGDAFDIAHKGAFTDARKIAFRPLGRTFGAYFSVDDYSIKSLDADDLPQPKELPPPKKGGASGTQPPALKPPLDPEIAKWWAEIKNAQEALGWNRKKLADYIRDYAGTPANELTVTDLVALYKALVAMVDSQKEPAV